VQFVNGSVLLDLNGFDVSGKTITVNASQTGFLGNTAATKSIWSGNVNLANATGSLRAGGTNAEVEISGTISGIGTLQSFDSGTLRLSGDNTYSGGTSVRAGSTLIVGHSNALGSVSHTNFIQAATLDLNGFDIGSRTITLQDNASRLVNDNTNAVAAVSGPVNMLTNRNNAQIGGDGNLTLSGNMATQDGTGGGFTKVGSGTLTLSGSNTYTGTTTVSSGTLVVSNASLTATIQSNSVAAVFSSAPTNGTNAVLPGPVGSASFVFTSNSVTGLSTNQTASWTNSPNLAVVVTTSTPANQKPVITAGQSFTIAENSAAGTLVGTLAATDADNTSSLGGWAITQGNSSSAFAIDPATGRLTVVGNLNFEVTPTTYTLTVTVSDGTDTSDPADVTVNVLNVSEFSDVFGSSNPSADDNGDGISNLMAYAMGATSSISVMARPELSLTSNNLTLTALVRTNDPKVQILGNASPALTNWPTNTFAGTSDGVDQTGANPGVSEKQRFSVERDTNSRLFLRLKATLEP
jgi:autotransporter-associated beta strand protein